MPGFELIGIEERNSIIEIFETSNGVMFAHGFDQLRNGRYRVREFEKAFSSKLNCNSAQAVTSGTVAQMIAMLALGIGPGDEVITQAFTFVATVEAIIAIRATPVLVDVDETYNMDPLLLENAITKRTKLIVPVHMLGNPCSMSQIMKIARDHKIPVLEDACEALGAQFNGQFVGTIGDAGFFSLDFGKTITCGEGGVITTNNAAIDKFCKEYHDHGHENNKTYPRGLDTRTMPGMNYRMTEMQAAFVSAQLKKLDFIVSKNREIKSLIKSNLLTDKIRFRDITDINGELADTLIFNFSNDVYADNFVKAFLNKGYSTKNIPDALNWHFAGTWSHIFKNIAKYENTYKSEWVKSANLLYRSVAIPIMLNMPKNEIERQIDVINNILRTL